MASFLNLKENILDQDLCTSCSLCVAACPRELLAMSDSAAPLPVFRANPGRPRTFAGIAIYAPRFARDTTPGRSNRSCGFSEETGRRRSAG